MNSHGKRCGEDCCHQMECCPRGLSEHIQHYRYLRGVTGISIDGEKASRITFFEYWWHELKGLIGLNRMSKEDRAELEADDAVNDMVTQNKEAR